MVPAVMITALLANRIAVAAAITLSIGFNLIMVHRESVLDATINAGLFAAVAWSIAEVCLRLIEAGDRSRSLAHDLQLRQAMLDVILASTPLVTLDRQGVMHRVTPAAADILGETQSQAVGRAFSDFVPAFDAQAIASIRETGVVQPPPDGHWPVIRLDGAKAPIAIHAGVLPEDVAPEHLVLSLADQRQSEVARDRVRDIQAQLNQVWRLNSMGQMAATLAHELNQPLTAATVYLHAGQADLDRSGPLGDSAGRSLELAKAQLLRAGHIIRRMRDLISSGSRSFAEESVASMIDDLAPVFSLISRDTDVPIRIDIHDQDDAVLADRIQIQQAVTNLVRNAVDAVSDRRDGIISLVGRSLGPEGYEIVIEDNGPGIAETDLDRIFQPLTTTKAGGMGLGLSVTRSIVESHGSQLVVGRSPLGGAVFSFRLPRLTETEAA